MSDYYIPASPEHIKKEKAKARELRQSLWWRQQIGRGICYHCEKKFGSAELTMDHLIPIGRGGKTSKKNCVLSCKECNSKKGARTKVEITMDEMSED
ncbi:MAG: HNH endonuclease [Bdellovibrionota bacterium]